MRVGKKHSSLFIIKCKFEKGFIEEAHVGCCILQLHWLYCNSFLSVLEREGGERKRKGEGVRGGAGAGAGACTSTCKNLSLSLKREKNVCSHKNETQQHQQHLAKCFQIPKRIFK
jgi:hypothetical protein